MKKQVKVVMLPTLDKKAPIILGKRDKLYISKDIPNIKHNKLLNPIWTYKHLYFLSDEDIKKGDNFYNPHTGHLHIAGNHTDYETVHKNGCKKIIATTDESLSLICTCGAIKKVPTGLCVKCGKFINTSIPRPSNEFIKKYCELGGIDEVLVEYEGIEWLDRPLEYFPKVALDNTITIYPKK